LKGRGKASLSPETVRGSWGGSGGPEAEGGGCHVSGDVRRAVQGGRGLCYNRGRLKTRPRAVPAGAGRPAGVAGWVSPGRERT
jgi:hypothetical protein